MSAALKRFALALALAAAGAAAAGTARAAAPERFSMIGLADSVKSNEDGIWSLGVRLVNGSEYGVYGDSLLLRVTPRGPGAPATPPAPIRLMLPAEATNMSAGSSVLTEFSMVASSADAHLEVLFHGHTLAGGPFLSVVGAEAHGSVFDGRYPSALIRAGGRNVEIVKVPAERPRGAGALLLPGEGAEARSMLPAAARLAREGASVVIVNAPGVGRSEGPDDYCGPASMAAARAALDTLKAMAGVDASNLAAWGRRRGATLALLLAAEPSPPVRVVVAQAGWYDLWAAFEAAAPEARKAMQEAAGRKESDWRSRSPLPAAVATQAAVLVSHGALDPESPVATARAFADSVQAHGGAVETRILQRAGDDLPPAEAVRFLRNRLHLSR